MANMRFWVDPPAFTALPYGLLTSLNEPLRVSSDPRWQMGISYEMPCGPVATTFDDCLAVTGSGVGQPVPPSPAKADTAEIVRRGATPFTVYSEIDCSAPGFWDDAERWLSESISHMEQTQVEQAFWTGLAGGQLTVFPHLQASAEVLDENGIILQTAATQVSGSAIFDVVEGLGRIEQALGACYGGVGTIHVPAVLGPALATNHLLERDGNRYRSPNGNVIVLGTGYRGTGPSDSPSASSAVGSTWIYATGAMFAYRGAATILPINESLDRANNTLKAIVERTYLIGWDCCHYAIQVSLGGVTSGATASAS